MKHVNTTPAEQDDTPPRASIGWMLHAGLVAWMVFVFGVHYATYYGPRLVRFWRFWIER